MESNTENVCIYCLKTIDLNDQTRPSFQLSQCSHSYHRDCFSNWIGTDMDKFYCCCGKVITQEDSIALNLPDPKFQCSVCNSPVDMNDKETKGGSVQLVRCPHRYHKICISGWLQRSRTETIKCGVCSRSIPTTEIIEVVGRGILSTNDASPPSSPTNGLTGILGNFKFEETEEEPLVDNRKQASNPQNPPGSSGVAPSERGQTHLGPKRDISPPRGQMSDQNVTNLLKDAARILSNDPKLPPLRRYIVTKKGDITNKLQCQTRTKKGELQCNHPAVFPYEDPVECKKHFNLRLTKDDADVVRAAKAEVSLIQSVHKTREKLRDITKEINIEAPRLIQESVNTEKEYNSEIEKLDITLGSVRNYLKTVSPRSSGSNSGSQTPIHANASSQSSQRP